MKKLILISLLIIMFGNLQAQNTLSVFYHPTDKGIGLRYDRQIQNSGLYIAMSQGNYLISESERINNHIKIVAGYVKYLDSKYYDSPFYISGGISYHHYSNRIIDLPDKVYYPLSIDLGCGVKFEHTMVGFIFDFVKQEGGVNFGINF